MNEENSSTPIPMEEYLKSLELFEMRRIAITDANNPETVLFYLETKGIPTAEDVRQAFVFVDHSKFEHLGKPLVVIRH